MCFQAERCASLQSAALLWVATETQSVIKALYIPLYLRDTRRPSQVAVRPVSKKKPQGTPESDWCLTDTPEQPMREKEMRGSGQVTVEDKCWVRWIKVQ